jgi:hypothetical protein
LTLLQMNGSNSEQDAETNRVLGNIFDCCDGRCTLKLNSPACAFPTARTQKCLRPLRDFVRARRAPNNLRGAVVSHCVKICKQQWLAVASDRQVSPRRVHLKCRTMASGCGIVSSNETATNSVLRIGISKCTRNPTNAIVFA